MKYLHQYAESEIIIVDFFRNEVSHQNFDTFIQYGYELQRPVTIKSVPNALFFVAVPRKGFYMCVCVSVCAHVQVHFLTSTPGDQHY